MMLNDILINMIWVEQNNISLILHVIQWHDYFIHIIQAEMSEASIEINIKFKFICAPTFVHSNVQWQ